MNKKPYNKFPIYLICLARMEKYLPLFFSLIPCSLVARFVRKLQVTTISYGPHFRFTSFFIMMMLDYKRDFWHLNKPNFERYQ